MPIAEEYHGMRLPEAVMPTQAPFKPAQAPFKPEEGSRVERMKRIGSAR